MSLDCVKFEVPDAKQAVVFFHGYGANMNDLASLHREMSLRAPTNWYFPDGFLEVPIGPGWTGKAWFPIPLRELEQSMLRGETIDFSKRLLPDMTVALNKAKKFLSSLPFSSEQIVLGGFSQGSMLATALAFDGAAEAKKYKALVLFSGTLLMREAWQKSMAIETIRCPIFQSHGDEDPVLPFDAAENLRDLFVDSKWSVDWYGFQGGHEIPRAVIKACEKFLNRI